MNEVIKLTIEITEEYHRFQLCIKFYPIFPYQGKLHIEAKLLWISVDSEVTVQPLIRYSAFIRYWRKNWGIMGHSISYL
jgi:hypothetical protein